MSRKGNYMTSQKEELLHYMKDHAGEHLTAMDVYNGMKTTGAKIGLTTVYRNLDKLSAEGEVIKFIVDENAPACFVYGEEEEISSDCHCRCLECGKLIHMHCHELERLSAHMREEHAFVIDPRRSVFYGLCSECFGKEAAL